MFVLALLSGPLAAAVTPLVNHDDQWQYHKGTNAPQSNWKAVDTVLDNSWASGRGGFGFGTTAQETNQCGTLLPDMKGSAVTSYTTLYLRTEFTVTAPAATNLHLFLRMDWDDGFIAWLDGVYLTSYASPGAPAEPAYTAVATNSASGGHESSGGQTPNPAVTNDLGAVGSRLGSGTHVLALIGLNVSQTSGDFVQVADLYLDSVPEPPVVTNPVAGTLAVDTTWFATNRIYTLTGNVTVASNATLTIEPGVTVWLRKGCGISVQGRLLADGTATNRILFTRYPGDTSWEQLKFVAAGDSRFRNCTFEYANCAGDHKANYPTNCNPPRYGPRVYREAVVGLGCRLEFEGCIFQDLFDETGTLPEGDAIAVVSDDPDHPGPASVTVRDCRFLYIGQGVNTRYAYALVENCYFVGKSGDNDDVELYGESTDYGLPTPVVRSNIFAMPCHDDRVHPTKCSALIYDNVIYGSGDHAIVLRDKCSPIVFNNVMYNCPSGGISIQNQCDAVLVNNTIINCGPGIKMFDHTDRWGPPYCLNPGSGRATVINCIIWNNTAGWDLAESPYTNDHGSHLTILSSDVQSNGNISASSTVVWGPGNLSGAPLFAGGTNYHLLAGSPCIDAGTNPGIVLTTNLSGPVTNDLSRLITDDFEGVPRPLDGNGDGSPRFDQGAYEYLLASADSNGDGIPDGWCRRYGLSPLDPEVAGGNPDHDPFVTFDEWLADTDPTNALSHFRIEAIAPGPPATVSVLGSSNRVYTLYSRSGVADGPWNPVPGQVSIPGTGGMLDLTAAGVASQVFYRVGVKLP